MWHNVGLTLLVFVATLLIVLLLMVCASGTFPMSPLSHQMTKILLDGITNAMNVNLGKIWEMVGDREARRAADHAVAKSGTGLGD